MMAWVLDTHYRHLFHKYVVSEASILVMDAGESALLDLMNHFVAKYPALKLFSLPRLDNRRTTELGMKGEKEAVEKALAEIKIAIEQLQIPWSEI
jgi:molybdopterin-biosynthesis enzyme MoeA-like protein